MHAPSFLAGGAFSQEEAAEMVENFSVRTSYLVIGTKCRTKHFRFALLPGMLLPARLLAVGEEQRRSFNLSRDWHAVLYKHNPNLYGAFAE